MGRLIDRQTDGDTDKYTDTKNTVMPAKQIQMERLIDRKTSGDTDRQTDNTTVMSANQIRTGG